MKYLFRHSSVVMFLAVLFLSFPKAVSAQQSSCDTLEHALLWRITHTDLADTSYLFGTIHLIGQEDFFWPEGFEQAFAKSKEVVFEINMDEMTSPLILLNMMTNMTMEGDTLLSDLLSEEDYALLGERMKAMGMPVSMINSLKPIFVTFLLMGEEAELKGMEDEMQQMTSYEMELYARAKEQHKKIGGLETADFQMSLFDRVPYHRQADMLSEMLHEHEISQKKEESALAGLINLYKQQDVNQLAKQSLEADPLLQDFGNVFIVERNKNWIPIMRQLMEKEGTVFFAVGAGHLGGQEGVICLLRAEGFRVEPLSR